METSCFQTPNYFGISAEEFWEVSFKIGESVGSYVAVSDLKGPSLYPNTSNKAHNLQARLWAPAAGLASALTHLQREGQNGIDLKA